MQMTLNIAPPISQSQERAQSSRLAFFVPSLKFASFDSEDGENSVRSSRAKDGCGLGNMGVLTVAFGRL